MRCTNEQRPDESFSCADEALIYGAFREQEYSKRPTSGVHCYHVAAFFCQGAQGSSLIRHLHYGFRRVYDLGVIFKSVFLHKNCVEISCKPCIVKIYFHIRFLSGNGVLYMSSISDRFIFRYFL